VFGRQACGDQTETHTFRLDSGCNTDRGRNTVGLLIGGAVEPESPGAVRC
jgi:hypothetical protein